MKEGRKEGGREEGIGRKVKEGRKIKEWKEGGKAYKGKEQEGNK